MIYLIYIYIYLTLKKCNNYLQIQFLKTYLNTINANSKTTFSTRPMIVKYSCQTNITHFSHTISCFFPCDRFFCRKIFKLFFELV